MIASHIKTISTMMSSCHLDFTAHTAIADTVGVTIRHRHTTTLHVAPSHQVKL
jgi:hypothetical protein